VNRDERERLEKRLAELEERLAGDLPVALNDEYRLLPYCLKDMRWARSIRRLLDADESNREETI
jgi:hypothetical protein